MEICANRPSLTYAQLPKLNIGKPNEEQIPLSPPLQRGTKGDLLNGKAIVHV